MLRSGRDFLRIAAVDRRRHQHGTSLAQLSQLASARQARVTDRAEVRVDARNRHQHRGRHGQTALFVRLEAKPGKEQEVESFLVSGLPLVEQEPATIAWFALKIAPSVYGIFDAFPDDAGREAHLSGKVAEALMARAADLFANAPEIMNIHVLAAKLPS